MDYRDQDSNSEGLYGARNENSVLFSLDSLNALDNETSNSGGTGFGNSGEESGLIDINTLTKMSGASSSSDAGDVAPIAMESMVFNQVVTKHEKRKNLIIVAVIAVLVIGAAIAIFMVVRNSQEELKHEQEAAQIEAQKQADEAKALREQIEELERQKKQAESDGQRRAADQQALEDQIKKLKEAEDKLNAGGAGAAPDADSGDKKGNKKTDAKKDSGGSDSPAAPAEPPKPKSAAAPARSTSPCSCAGSGCFRCRPHCSTPAASPRGS